MADFNWNKVKAEYISTNISYRKLADKYGISRTTLQRRAIKENWFDKRKQKNAKVEAKILDSAEADGIDYKSKLYDLAYKVASQLVEVTDNRSMEELMALGIKPRDITGAIKDLEDALHIKSERDIREQEARIKSLQKQVEQEQESKDITVTIIGGDDNYSD